MITPYLLLYLAIGFCISVWAIRGDIGFVQELRLYPSHLVIPVFAAAIVFVSFGWLFLAIIATYKWLTQSNVP